LLEGEKRLGLLKGDVHIYRIEEFLERKNLAKTEFESRRNYLSAYKKFNPPNEFGGNMMIQEAGSNDGSQLQGIGCSSGEVVGVVRVIARIEEAHQLQVGEVLVTKFTDPGWTPIMSRAAAIITEVGGVLSHAAVIGREYKIPAVLNVNSVCIHLKTGDLVKVNGRTGTISKLEKVS
jgi:phosphoenolpyruvate synthase/pyruvate phosphate dikinase